MISFAETVSISSEIRVGMKMLTLRIKSIESSVHSQIMSIHMIYLENWKLRFKPFIEGNFRFFSE